MSDERHPYPPHDDGIARSEGDGWDRFRRVHFLLSDTITYHLQQSGVSLIERRLLDSLVYAERLLHRSPAPTAASTPSAASRGAAAKPTAGLTPDAGAPVGSVTVETLCAMTPSGMKTQTVASALERMRRREWVEPVWPEPGSDDGARGGRSRAVTRWRLKKDGRNAQRSYMVRVRDEIERFLDPPPEPTADAGGPDVVESLLDHDASAARQVARRLHMSVMSFEGRASPIGVDGDELNGYSDLWEALRSARMYSDDTIYQTTEQLGIGPNERRILDLMVYAGKRKVVGLTTSQISRLNVALTRPQVEASIERMHRRGWIEDGSSARSSSRRPRRRWVLTPAGRDAQQLAKQTAISRLRDLYPDPATAEAAAVLARAEAHRNREMDRHLPPSDTEPGRSTDRSTGGGGQGEATDVEPAAG